MEPVGTLYHNPLTRSSKVLWLANEINIKLKVQIVNILTGDHKKPEYLKINPRGLLPAYEDAEGFILVESNAVILHLLDKCDKDGKFGGKPGTDQRAHLYRWSVWVAGNDKVTSDAFANLVALPEPMRDKQIYADSVRKWNEGIGDALLKELADKKFFWSDQFSAVDIPVAFMIRAAIGAKLLEDAKWKPLRDYFGRVSQIESFKKVFDQQ